MHKIPLIRRFKRVFMAVIDGKCVLWLESFVGKMNVHSERCSFASSSSNKGTILFSNWLCTKVFADKFAGIFFYTLRLQFMEFHFKLLIGWRKNEMISFNSYWNVHNWKVNIILILVCNFPSLTGWSWIEFKIKIRFSSYLQ